MVYRHFPTANSMSCHPGGENANSKVDGRLLGDEDAWIQDSQIDVVSTCWWLIYQWWMNMMKIVYKYIYIYISFFFISLSENRWHQEMNDWGIKPVSFSPQEALKKLQQVATHPITTISKLGWYVWSLKS